MGRLPPRRRVRGLPPLRPARKARGSPRLASSPPPSRLRPIRQRRRGTALVTVALAAALPTAVTAGTGVPDEQLWTELDVVAPVADNTTITGIAQLRLSESLPNPILTALGADLNYKTGEWTLGIGYRHEVTGNRQGEEPDITQVVRLPVTW